MAMRIGELARRAGLAASAVRYYEYAGLLAPAGRADNGYRVYGPESLGRLDFIRRAQALGLTVREIQELLRGPEADGESERARLRHLVAHKLAQADSRLGELAALRDELQGLYVRLSRSPAPACGHVGDCGCWLPNEKEVIAMAEEVCSVEQCGCTGCPDPGCDCGCGCCATGR